MYKRRLKLRNKKEKQDKAATLIQKLLRGYIQSNKILGAIAS
jgi:hypothetical protein